VEGFFVKFYYSPKEKKVKTKYPYTLAALLMLTSILLAACAPAAATTAAPQPTAAAAGDSAGEVITVQVASDATWPPFEMVDETSKEIVGFDIDLIKEVGKRANLNVEIQNVGFDPLMAGISQCQYDMAISAITITDERKESMLFSDGYISAGQLVAVQASNTDINGFEDLKGKTVGAQIGTTGAIEISNLEGATLKTYDTVDLAYLDLMNGQVDAVVADNPTALAFIGKNPDKLKSVGEAFTDEVYGIAICKDKPELVERVNKALASLKSEGFLDQLTQEWLTEEQ